MERKYRMTQLPGGDWTFLANDGETLCRVGSYEEDGSAEDGRGGYITGRFWSSFHFDGTLGEAEELLEREPDDFIDRWALKPYYGGQWWRELASMQRTRREAIDYALEVAERKKVAAMREP